MRKQFSITIIFMLILMYGGMTVTYANDEPSLWARTFINDAMERGKLTEDGRLFSNYKSDITRKDFAYLSVMLYEEIMGIDVSLGSESFADTTDEYALKAKKIGVVSGYENNLFKPDKPISREELATMFMNLFKVMDVEFNQTIGTKFFDDHLIEAWAKESVYLARTNGIISGVGNNTFNPKFGATIEQALIMYMKAIQLSEKGPNLDNYSSTGEAIIKDSTFGEFIVTFDSLFVYNGSYLVGGSEDALVLSELTYNKVPTESIESLLSGSLSGAGIIVKQSIDKPIISHSTYAPFLSLVTDPGVYTIYHNNDIVFYIVGGSLKEALAGELKYKTVIYPLENNFENNITQTLSPVSSTQLRILIEENFKYNTSKFYTVGTKEPAEYLSKYVNSYRGYSFFSWLHNTNDFTNTNAILLDDSSNAFSKDDPILKEKIMTFLPEIYEIRKNGIYIIENDQVNIIYIKSNAYDIRHYIDYLYGVTAEEIPVFSFSTGRSIAGKTNTIGNESINEILPVSEFYHEPVDNYKSFQGFYHNASYDNVSKFLRNGVQTQSETAKKIAATINDKKDISTIKEIYQFTSTQLAYGDGEKFGRTSEEILSSGISTGCTDYGLAFISIAREKGIPSVFVQTGRIDWIYDRVRNNDKGITGHILVEVYLDGNWYLVDTTAGKLFLNYNRNNFSLNDGYYVFSKSLDVWDSTILNEADNYTQMREVFKHFNIAAYKEPLYDYINLSTGKTETDVPFVWWNLRSISSPEQTVSLDSSVDKSGNLSDKGFQRLLYFEADPSKGFNYPYVIILPSSGKKLINMHEKQYLLVEPNNFGRSSNSLSDHIVDVLSGYKNTLPGSYLGEELWMPRMMPIFPRYILENNTSALYTHSLDSTTVFIEDIANTLKSARLPLISIDEIKKLFGLEKQMYNMIEDAKNRLNDYGWAVQEKVFMVGFSASGNFVNRYTSIYPEQLKATYAGGVNSNIILPGNQFENNLLMYPVGTNEHTHLFGRSFDLEEYNNVAKLVYMGRQDTNETFDYKSPYDPDEKALIIKLFGNNLFPDRWDGHRKAFYELGGHGIFLTNLNAKHGSDYTDRNYVIEFFKINRDSIAPNYDVKVIYSNLEVIKSLEEMK